MCRPPSAEHKTAAADRWARRQLSINLLRAVSAMVLIPVTPGVLKSAYGDGAKVAAHSADLTFYAALLNLAVGPLAGALGDGRVGRKPILLACIGLQIVGACCVLLAHEGVISVAGLFRAQLAQNVGAVTLMTTTTACVGDAFAHDRTKVAAAAGRLGGLTMGVGMLLGPALGAAVAKAGGPRAVAAVALAGGVSALLGQALLVPETRRVARVTGSWVDAALKPLRATSVLFCNGPALRYLACASSCFALCRGESAVYSAFMMEVWGAGPGGLAAAMTVVGAAFAAAQALLVRPLVAGLGAADALRAGYLCSTLQRVCWATFTHPALMALGLLAGSPGFGGDACVQQLALVYHPSADPPRGELAAAFASLGTVAVLCSSRAISFLFTWGSARGWPGAPFALGLGASLCALGFA
eukprot:CAMPEP_0119286604 /NCGR_PEP_ID=MMETSP1329-20130426/34144_1 /TAXON_ID=114041 /ORGANISM="Genus nov. species nov., Strain RCC1024" /LENGTH=412 /DNA_ID=CAMNT_0007287345 /DNA_START=119 /DNA_END=1353 /DNA_ORIENTATION=+